MKNSFFNYFKQLFKILLLCNLIFLIGCSAEDEDFEINDIVNLTVDDSDIAGVPYGPPENDEMNYPNVHPRDLEPPFLEHCSSHLFSIAYAEGVSTGLSDTAPPRTCASVQFITNLRLNNDPRFNAPSGCFRTGYLHALRYGIHAGNCDPGDNPFNDPNGDPDGNPL